MTMIPFDDRDGVIWYDGKMVDWRDAKLHVLSHALHYASAVFEGQRSYGGEIFKLNEHTERLHASANLLDFKIPYSVGEINKAANEAVAANNLVDAYVRPIAWRGSEQMSVPAMGATVHVAIAAWQWPSYFTREARMKGIRMNIAKWKRPSPETAPSKSKAVGLYMICTLSKHDAMRADYDDALMFDWRGQIAEATGANIFFVDGQQIHTPTPDCFLDGITRRTVIDLAKKRGFEIVERAIMPDEMEGFQQAFLTGTAAEVTPIREIGDYNFEVGKIAKQLVTDYDDLVNRRQVGV